MGRVADFALPDLGEGLTEGEILRWLVAPGDSVALNQPIVEVETAKAAVEVPSPYAGTVVRLHHGEGSTVDVGAVLISVETEDDDEGRGSAAGAAGAGAQPGAGDASGAAADVGVAPDAIGAPAEPREPVGAGAEERTAVLVGYGPRAAGSAPRRRRPPLIRTVPAAAPATPPPPARVSAGEVAAKAAARLHGAPVLATPPVRKLAKDLGVDLSVVTGTGTGGVVTRADVHAATQAAASPPGGAAVGAGAVGAGAVGAGAVGAGAVAPQRGERRIPVRGVRRLTAQNMVTSAFTAPHVTEFLTVDATESLAMLARMSAWPEFKGLRLTPLVLVARALMVAVQRHPEINASWDEAAGEIVVKDYIHLGIAAATPRGLMVPVLRDADLLVLPDLARALADLAATAREGRTAPGDLSGSTITITNVGVFGVDTGTPILNPGEAAILALGAIRQRPWVVDGELAVRSVVQLALSFDHRMVDGALGSAVLADLGVALTDPARLIAWS